MDLGFLKVGIHIFFNRFSSQEIVLFKTLFVGVSRVLKSHIR